MNELEPHERKDYNNAWNEVEAMAEDYNKANAIENKERAELNHKTMENIQKNKRASKTFRKIASGALAAIMITTAGITMGIAAGNAITKQEQAKQLNKVTHSITTFIEDNGEERPWKISTQPAEDGVMLYEKRIYHDDINCDINDKATLSKQLETALPELELEKSNGISIEWMNGDYVYRADDVNCDGSWNIITRTEIDTYGQGPYFLADDEEIPESWSTMGGVEQYFAENIESK